MDSTYFRITGIPGLISTLGILLLAFCMSALPLALPGLPSPSSVSVLVAFEVLELVLLFLTLVQIFVSREVPSLFGFSR